MAEQQAGVVVFYDIEPALEMLNAEQRGHLFTAIVEYGHYGTLPTFDDQLVQMAWSFVRPSIDRANKKYEDSKVKKRIAGITSDFKRNYAPRQGIDPDDRGALQDYVRRQLSTSVNFWNVAVDGTVFENGIEAETGGGDGKGGVEGKPRQEPPIPGGVTEEKKRAAIEAFNAFVKGDSHA